jgi:hypothetical protein
MTPEEELELIAIRRRRLELEALPQVPPQETPLIPTGVGRDILSAGAMGASKGMAGMFDLLHAGSRNMALQRARETGEPAPPETDSISSYVDRLRDQLAGRPLEKSVPAAIAEGATGSLIYPGGPVTNAVAGGIGSGVTQTLLNREVSPGKAAGVGAGTSLGLAATMSLANPRRILLVKRLRESLGGMNEDDLSETVRMQSRAAARGVPLFPSQASPGLAPGMQQLETEILRSKSPGAADVQQLGFKQAPLADQFAQETLRKTLPTRADLSQEKVAENLQVAALKRAKADFEAVNARTEELYTQAGKSEAVVDIVAMKPVLEQLNAVIKSPTTAAESKKALRNLANQLVKESAQYKGQIPVQRLRTIYQDMESNLEKVNAVGLPDYSDRAAGQIRKAINGETPTSPALRNAYEEAEPLFGAARVLQSSGKEAAARGPFDPVVQLSKGRGSAEKYTEGMLGKAEALTDIASGAPAKGGVRLGSDKDAVRDALANSLETQRQKAFQLSNAGEMLQNSPAIFVRNLIGTDTKRRGLEGAMRSIGIDPKTFMADMEVLQAAGRPTVVHGSRVPSTGIDPADVARATIGGSLQQQQARMSMLRSWINRISDKQIAEILERPDSVAYIQKVAGASAMDPRQLVAVMLASKWQEQEADSTKR